MQFDWAPLELVDCGFPKLKKGSFLDSGTSVADSTVSGCTVDASEVGSGANVAVGSEILKELTLKNPAIVSLILLKESVTKVKTELFPGLVKLKNCCRLNKFHELLNGSDTF